MKLPEVPEQVGVELVLHPGPLFPASLSTVANQQPLAWLLFKLFLFNLRSVLKIELVGSSFKIADFAQHHISVWLFFFP